MIFLPKITCGLNSSLFRTSNTKLKTFESTSYRQGLFVKKLRRSSLSSDAYTFIRESFLNDKRYNPGDKISVEKLSRELGVSRTPLWGAINRLEAEGIVEVVPRMGVYLTSYDTKRMLDIFQAREA